jgi:hypothetical protein
MMTMTKVLLKVLPIAGFIDQELLWEIMYKKFSVGFLNRYPLQ